MLKKIGTPEKISVIKLGTFSFDANLLAKKVIKRWKGQAVSLDQLHEFVKSHGITDYTSEDMQKLIGLVQSAGVAVSR